MMMNKKNKWALSLLLGVLVPAASSAEIYRWTDENGNIVYSDQPRKGAETVKVEPAPTYKAQPYQKITPEEKPAQEEVFTYASFTIAAPGEKETIWNNPGNVSVTFSIDPALKVNEGHKIVFSMDQGESRETTSMNYVFQNINRGTHTLQAQVKDAQNNPLSTSESVTFFLKRQSVNLPSRKSQ